MHTIADQYQSPKIDPDHAMSIIAHNKKSQHLSNHAQHFRSTSTRCQITRNQSTLTITNNRVQECTLPYSEVFIPKNKTRTKKAIQGKTITLKCGSTYRINAIKDIIYSANNIILIYNFRKNGKYIPAYIPKNSIKRIE